jgi:hypothetical protein
VIERIEAVQEVCAGLTEISITVKRAAPITQASSLRSLRPHVMLPGAVAEGGGHRPIERVRRRSRRIGSLYAAHLSHVAGWCSPAGPSRACPGRGLG